MTQPIELRLTNAGKRLEVVWRDDRTSGLSARRLRAACRCAACVRARADGAPIPSDDSVAITAIEPVGGYAVNLGFSDGHARGIFPWVYLRELADAEAISCSTAQAPPDILPAALREGEEA